jgi:hypothetical protein
MEIDSQRQDGKKLPAVKGAAVTDEDNTEMAPTFRPEQVHFLGRGAQAQETFIVFGCGHDKL